MGFYQNRILPRLIDFGMRQQEFEAYRGRVVSAAAGKVLEIGIGSGLNLPFYGDDVTQVIGLDPSPPLLAMAQKAARPKLPVELIEASAEAIPLENASVDTVLTTWTLCSIPDAVCGLGEMRRVLKPSGILLFVEHGRAQDARVCRWQDRLTPIWKRFGGGCHLNRPIADLIASAGFRLERLENGYMPGPRPLTYMYEGKARPR
jgi:ubiquinone/menaquinone biosynthesis C-methylase UbiE